MLVPLPCIDIEASGGPIEILLSFGSVLQGLPVSGLAMSASFSPADIPTRRRIGSSQTTFIYNKGIRMDFTLVTGAASAISTAIEIGKGALAARDSSKLSDVVIAMNDQLLNAQQSLFVHNASLMELQQKHFEATQELRKVKEALAERERYSLFEITQGVFVYRVNVAPHQSGAGLPSASEPEHYVCQPCLDGPTKSKVVLRYYPNGSFGPLWHCVACRQDIWVSG